MPVCQGCGGSYDDKFKFCPHCGRAKPEPNIMTINVNVTSDDVWETCEIYLVYLNKSTFGNLEWYLEATAIGPQGKYAAATSQKLEQQFFGARDYYSIDNKPYNIRLTRNKCEPKLNDLIKKLVSDGWQPVGRGQEWYSERFRRQVKK
jgi:hypothetical protein